MISVFFAVFPLFGLKFKVFSVSVVSVSAFWGMPFKIKKKKKLEKNRQAKKLYISIDHV
jgi:hypothetical protein